MFRPHACAYNIIISTHFLAISQVFHKCSSIVTNCYILIHISLLYVWHILYMFYTFTEVLIGMLMTYTFVPIETGPGLHRMGQQLPQETAWMSLDLGSQEWNARWRHHRSPCGDSL